MGELGALLRQFVTQALLRQGLDLRLVYDSRLGMWSVVGIVGDVTHVHMDESLATAMSKVLSEVTAT